MIGILSGVAKDNSKIDVIFEVFQSPTETVNTVSLFGGLATVSQSSSSGVAVNAAGLKFGGKNNGMKGSEMRILTFDDFKRTSAGRWATHEVLGQKAKLEYIGPGLEEISFSILLNVGLGVSPKDELVKLRQIRDEGIACTLIIGNEPVTDNLVVLQKLDEDWQKFDGRGNLLVASVNLSLMEYVEEYHGT